MIHRRIVAWMFLVVAASAPVAAHAQQRAPAAGDSSESRIALIIGNSAYKTQPLANPVNDARAMAKVLNEAGFTVRVATNITRSQMRDEIRKFGEQLRDQRGVGLFFFAGHGVQVNGRNYLLPVGGDIRREHEVEDEAVDANFVLSTMEYAKARMNIVILDACRDNPFAGSFRSTMRGLAPMNAPGSTIIAYATAPGQTASDGTGANGLYTHHLVEQISTPGLSLSDLFINVRNGVQRESNGRQTPWELASLTEKFYFKPPVAAAAPAPASVASSGSNAADVDRAVQAALRKREDEEAARRSTQQSEIERAVLAALRKREEEQAAAQSARADKENQEAKLAIERLNKELAELRAVREAAPPPASRPVTAPTSPGTAAPQQSSSAPVQLALAAPSAPRPAPAVSVGGRVERPEVRVGDSWKYQISDGWTGMKDTAIVEVATVTENRIYTRSTRSALATLDPATATGVVNTWDRDWNQLREGEIEYTPFNPSFQFPLENGKTWPGNFGFISGSGDNVTNQSTIKVVGWEKVTVPAGTFDAVKITFQGSFHVASGGSRLSGFINNVVWYAPAVRQFVRKEIERRTTGVVPLLKSVGDRNQLYERWELLEYKGD